jgi:hypothetical protein
MLRNSCQVQTHVTALKHNNRIYSRKSKSWSNRFCVAQLPVVSYVAYTICHTWMNSQAAGWRLPSTDFTAHTHTHTHTHIYIYTSAKERSLTEYGTPVFLPLPLAFPFRLHLPTSTTPAGLSLEILTWTSGLEETVANYAGGEVSEIKGVIRWNCYLCLGTVSCVFCTSVASCIHLPHWSTVVYWYNRLKTLHFDYKMYL